MQSSNALKVVGTGDRELVITRSFAAPRPLLFEALTKPELLKRWFLGPPGWELAVCEVDLQIGGRYRHVWKNQDGRSMGMSGEYREVRHPDHLVHTEVFDEAWYPGHALVTTDLVDKGGVTFFTCTVLYESAKARDMNVSAEIEAGIAASYDRLEQLLRTMRQ